MKILSVLTWHGFSLLSLSRDWYDMCGLPPQIIILLSPMLTTSPFCERGSAQTCEHPSGGSPFQLCRPVVLGSVSSPSCKWSKSSSKFLALLSSVKKNLKRETTSIAVTHLVKGEKYKTLESSLKKLKNSVW